MVDFAIICFLSKYYTKDYSIFIVLLPTKRNATTVAISHVRSIQKLIGMNTKYSKIGKGHSDCVKSTTNSAMFHDKSLERNFYTVFTAPHHK